MIRKFARFEVLAAAIARPGHVHVRTAHRANFDYMPKVGYLYVRSRAISSRCNDNFDEFPAADIKAAYATFIGKPVFVNHNNANHRRARGVIVDAALHEDVNPDGSPDTWVEVLMEVDAIRFPKLAQAIIAGDVARTSMGCDVEFSVCSYCGNKARTPLEYCGHIPALKGQRIRRRTASGDGNEDVLVSERCHGLLFFENSLLVEPPADPTAYFLGVDTRGLQTAASLGKMAVTVDDVDYDPHGSPNLFPGEQAHWPPKAPDALDPRKKPADEADPDDGFADLDSLNRDVLERAEEGQRRVRETGHTGMRTVGALRVVSGDDAVVVPPEVDTLRDIKCPAGFNENDSACGFDGSECAVCGYIKPIEDFDDPDTSKAKELDRDKAIEATEDEIEEQEEETDMGDQPRPDQKLSTDQQVRALRTAFVEQGRLYAEAIAARDKNLVAANRKIAALGQAVEFLAAQGGLTGKLAQHLGMVTADINNPAQPVPEPPAEPASTTTEQERDHGTPVDLFAPGAVPGATDVLSPPADLFGVGGDMTAPPPVDVEDVEAPVAGTGPGEVPLADVRTETEVEVGPSPAQVPVFTGSRTMQAIQLARLRQEANVADPDASDLALGNAIETSDMSNEAMLAEITTLSAVISAQRRTSARTAATGRRDLVPRLANTPDGSRSTPSLAPAGVGDASGGGEFSADEFAFAE